MKTTIAQFIPIVIIMLLLSYSKEFVEFSHSILGKLTALALILFYTYLDKYLGVVICLSIIIYYQSDYVENMLNTDDIMNKLVEKFEQNKSIQEDEQQVSGVEQSTPVKGPTKLNESMTILSRVYGSNSNTNEGMSVIDQFRDEHCKGTTLMHKNMKVKPDMIEHLYPNIQFNKGKCNICDSTCEFSIIENRLKTEKALLYDKDKADKATELSTCETCNSK